MLLCGVSDPFPSSPPPPPSCFSLHEEHDDDGGGRQHQRARLHWASRPDLALASFSAAFVVPGRSEILGGIDEDTGESVDDVVVWDVFTDQVPA